MDGLVAAIISGICAIVGSAIGASDLSTGWVRSALRMTELYDRLPTDGVPRSTEVLARRMLRQRIYDSIYHGLGCRMDDGVPVPRDRTWPTVREAIFQNLCALASALIVGGVPKTPRGWAVIALGLAIGWIAVRLLERLLKFWPAKPWNPFYRIATKERKRKEEARTQIKEVLEEYDRWVLSSYGATEDSAEDSTV